MKRSNSDSINISGGHFNADALAIGQGAKAHSNRHGGSGLDDKTARLLALIDQFREQVESGRSAVPNHDEVRQAILSVKDEVTKSEPNRLTVKSVLSGIREAVQTTSSLVTIVDHIQAAAKALLG